MKKANNRGFTLIEMLVVIGIIAILVGTSIAGFSGITKSAEKAKGQELVANAATALTALFQEEGCWPKKLAAEGKDLGEIAVPVAEAAEQGAENTINLKAKTGRAAYMGDRTIGVKDPGATATAMILRAISNYLIA